MDIKSDAASAAPPEAGPETLLCMGYGPWETHAVSLPDGKPNPHPAAGRSYEGTTPREIGAMARNPPYLSPETAPWFIPSVYRGFDARSEAAQRKSGEFRILAFDVDSGNLSLDLVDWMLRMAAGDVTRLIYSTHSATAENRKWRALMLLQHPIAGADYATTLTTFYRLMGKPLGIPLAADKALLCASRPVGLPNRGDYYEYRVLSPGPLNLHPVQLVPTRLNTVYETSVYLVVRRGQFGWNVLEVTARNGLRNCTLQASFSDRQSAWSAARRASMRQGIPLLEGQL